MANQQPPTRSWFRLGSIARPAPVPAAAPPVPGPALTQPRPPLGLPSFRPIARPPPTPAPSVPAVASVPSSPARRASVPSSPITKPSPPPATLPAGAPTMTREAEQLKSPKDKPTAPPPSLLSLPPAQLKSQAENKPKMPVKEEQKTVLVQKTIQKPNGWSNGDSHKDLGIATGNQESYKDGDMKERGHRRFTSDPEMKAITISGENRGAFMELIQSPQKRGFEGKPHYLHKNGNSNGKESHNYSSSDNGNRKMKDKGLKSKAWPGNAYVNSNVQGVNSSIVYNSTSDHQDPGVHLALFTKLTGDGGGRGSAGFQVKERGNGYNS